MAAALAAALLGVGAGAALGTLGTGGSADGPATGRFGPMAPGQGQTGQGQTGQGQTGQGQTGQGQTGQGQLPPGQVPALPTDPSSGSGGTGSGQAATAGSTATT